MASTPSGSINLLPEVKVLKMKGQKYKRLSTVVTIMLGLVFGGIITGLIFITIYYAAEGSRLKSNTEKLQAKVNESKQTELSGSTIQEHLSSFSTLNKNRIEVTAVFSQLVKTIPPNVTISAFQLNTNYLGSVSGTTDSYKSLGVFTKALEDYNVTFKKQEGLDRAPIFSDVAIASASKDTSSNVVTFTMNFQVDQNIVKKNQNSGTDSGTINSNAGDTSQ